MDARTKRLRISCHMQRVGLVLAPFSFRAEKHGWGQESLSQSWPKTWRYLFAYTARPCSKDTQFCILYERTENEIKSRTTQRVRRVGFRKENAIKTTRKTICLRVTRNCRWRLLVHNVCAAFKIYEQTKLWTKTVTCILGGDCKTCDIRKQRSCGQHCVTMSQEFILSLIYLYFCYGAFPGWNDRTSCRTTNRERCVLQCNLSPIVHWWDRANGARFVILCIPGKGRAK